MINNSTQSHFSPKRMIGLKLFKRKVLLGVFSLAVLILGTFCAIFLNTAQAKSKNVAESSINKFAPEQAVVADDPVTGCPANYTALGGIISSNPTASVINSRVVVFARGTDGTIYYQISTGFPFSGWISLGGNTPTTPMSTVIGTTLYVEVVGTDGNRYYRSTIDGSTYSDWKQGTVGATTNSNATLGTINYSFLRGATGTQPNLCALLITGATPTPTITLTPTPTGTPNAVTGCPAGYTALGGVISSDPTASVLNNRVIVFARATTGEIYFQQSVGGTFSGWNNLGGNTNSPPMSIVIGATLYVEVIGTDGNRYYKSSTDGLGFSSWTLGTVGATINSSVIAGTTGYSFLRGATGTQPNLCALVTTGVNPTPTPTITPTPTPTGTPGTVTGCPVAYTALGGVITSDPTASALSNIIVAFAKGTDGSIYFQYSTGGSFSGWNNLGGGTNANPKSIVVGTTLYVEVVGTDGKNYYRSTTDGLTYTAWTEGTFGATTNSSVVFGTTGYSFLRGAAGTQPNLCVLVTPGVVPTPTPTPVPNTSTGCTADYVSLGGFIASNPTASVFNNRVYAFAKGTDGALYFQYSTGSVFSGWNALGGGTNADPKSIVVGSTMYIEVVGTDSKNYYRSTTDGLTYTAWTEGTFSATNNPAVVFGGKTYTFAKGSNNTPHLCVKIQ